MGHEAQSAGTDPADGIHQNAISALTQLHIDTSSLFPKLLKDIEYGKDYIICSMGCGVACPAVPIKYNFGIADPKDDELPVFIDVAVDLQKKIEAMRNLYGANNVKFVKSLFW